MCLPAGYNVTQLEVNSLAPVEYRLLGSLPQFSVTADGRVYVSAPLDREQDSVFSLGVVAEAQQLTSLTVLTIVVLDVNDNAPVFHNQLYQTTLSEGVNIGTSVIQGTVTFTLCLICLKF